MKIEFNALGAVSDIITNDEPLRQGNVGANTLTAVFEGKSNLAYTATFNYTRSDDGRLKDIPLTPTANAGEYTYKFNNLWFFALYGETTLTVYLKNSANEIVASGQITFSIEQTDFDTDTTITYEEYEALLDAITDKQDKFNLNNVRGYNTLALATADLPNLADGQMVIIRDGGSSIYQVQAGELVDLIVNKATSDSLGNVIKDSYVSAVYPTYNTTTDKLFIETYSVEDVLLANNEVILPKATTTKNGLMAKEDKVKVDGFQPQIDAKFETIVNDIGCLLNESYRDYSTDAANHYQTGFMQKTGATFTSGVRLEASVNPNKKYRITGTSVSVDYPLVVYLDSSNNVVGFEKADGSVTPYIDYEPTIPSTASKMVINGYELFMRDNSGNIQRVYPRACVKEVNAFEDNLEDELNLKATKKTEWKKVNYIASEDKLCRLAGDGTLSSTAASGYGRYIYNFNRNKKYRFNAYDYNINAITIGAIFGLDATGHAIFAIKLTTNNSDAGSYLHLYRDYELDNDEIPLEVSQLVISGGAPDSIRLQVLEEREQGISLVDNQKKGVCFGDSITQGNNAYVINDNTTTPFSYPALIEKKLNCKIYNAGLGGSTATGDRSIDLPNIVDCILSGNFNSIFTGITQYNLNHSAKANFTEIEELDFNDVDFVTFAYGTNDWAFNNTASEFIAALQTQINRLLTAYPQLKVYIFTPIIRFKYGTYEYGEDWVNENTGQSLLDFVDAEIDWAKGQCYPVKDAFRTLGINGINRGQYFDDSDGTHPQIVGYELIADKFAKFINSN